MRFFKNEFKDFRLVARCVPATGSAPRSSLVRRRMFRRTKSDLTVEFKSASFLRGLPSDNFSEGGSLAKAGSRFR